MMYALCKTEKRNTPLMVTLTYPDEFNPHPRVWARDIKVFLQRLGREFPSAAGFWREELKRRKTGKNIGKIAPHFHLLVWGVDYIDMWSFVAHAWWAVVGSMNDKHLKAGTRVDVVHSVDGIKRYASKYASKADDEKELYLEASKLGPVGRVWGMFNQDKIPWSECYEMETTNAQANDLLRLMRRYAHLKMRSNTPSMTIMVNDPLQWMRPLLC